MVDLIRLRGFEPVVLTDPGSELAPYSGLVLPGGGDIDPARYGGSAIDVLYDINPAQDELDFMLTEQAFRADIPILGICRGAQVINVVFGGTLFEDLPPTSVEHCRVPLEEEDMDFVWHDVHVVEGTHLANASNSGRFSIASGHHQGIHRLGTGLKASATAEDGLVEAFENADGSTVGVQWHPEVEGMKPAIRDAPFRVFEAAISRRNAKARFERSGRTT
ncbi:gamma-glutamyl-gamma-aminobutyrate hydrolase family protein [Paenarthrobacter sp. TAF1]|uniref:gamma-glutamyl-gamma-aminobutyrate hydrolase family protein n=1 Tax=Paenarthrobacter sp. TAF1 TaxID=3233067 RepID=UPI003F990753